MTTRTRTAIKSPEALAALTIISREGFIRRNQLQRAMGDRLFRIISDDEFEAAMTEIGSRIIRTRGAGGGIRLF